MPDPEYSARQKESETSLATIMGWKANIIFMLDKLSPEQIRRVLWYIRRIW